MAIKTSGKATTKAKDEIKYEILEECGVISENGKNKTLLRYIKWNDNEPKYDLRTWYTDKDGNEKMSKGITLTGEELIALGEIIKKLADE